jgi:aspartokinase/homoserine dehydrogenase 1
MTTGLFPDTVSDPVNEKPWQVYKFGGTSLGTPGRLPSVLQLIEAAPKEARLAVVVSALGDTTDYLIAAFQAAGRGDAPAARAEMARVRRLALDTAGQVLAGRALDGFAATVDAILGPVEAGLGKTGRTIDDAMAAGEPISVALVSAALRERGRGAFAVDARDFMAADVHAGAAVVDWAETVRRFGPVSAGWEAGSVPVVTGFLARARDGGTLTLGRNGSDYTATLMAALLKAGTVTVWTDVSGVMTADPAIVPQAVPVDRLSYDEALELAYFGTRMFHPRTIIPLRESGAAMHIRSTTHPGAPGTRIDAVGNTDPNRPTCVTSLENLSLLGVHSRQAAIGRPLGGRLLTALDAAGVRVWLTTESMLGQTFSVIVPKADEAHAQRIIGTALAEELRDEDLTLVSPRAPVTMVTLVAGGMGERPGVAGLFLGAIGKAGVVVCAVAQGASQRSISCVVDAAGTAAAVRTVHAALNLRHA